MPFDMDAFVAEARAAQLGQAVSAARRGAPRPGRVRPPAGRPPGARPDFRRTDVLVANHSGGKDGLPALFKVVEQASGQRVLNELIRDGRLVVQYNRLGSRVSWPGTAAMGRHADRLVELYGDRPGSEDLARAHAEHFGLRFEVTERERTVVEVGPDGVKRESAALHCSALGRVMPSSPPHRLGRRSPILVEIRSTTMDGVKHRRWSYARGSVQYYPAGEHVPQHRRYADPVSG